MVTTHRVDKYGDERLSLTALEDYRSYILSGSAVARFNHDGGVPLDIVVLDAEIRPIGEEHGVVATLSIADDDWTMVKAHFDAAGVRGGWSYTRSERAGSVGPTAALEAGEAPSLFLVADAAAFSDQDRNEAALAMATHSLSVVDIERSYSYSDVSTATFLILGAQAVGWGIIASASWDGIKALAKRGKAPHRIELRREGDDFSAIIATPDPELARAALEQLPTIARVQNPPPAVFDADSEEWTWPRRSLPPVDEGLAQSRSASRDEAPRAVGSGAISPDPAVRASAQLRT